jgi:hypothetical protein
MFFIVKAKFFPPKTREKNLEKNKRQASNKFFLLEDTNSRDYTEEGFHAITAGRSFQFQLSNLNLMYAIILY